MFKTLFDLRIKEMLYNLGGKKRKGKAKNNIGMAVLYLFSFFAIGQLFVMMFATIYKPYEMLELTWLYFAFTFVMAFMLCFIGSVFLTQTQMFDAKDNEMLLSMPIKPISIISSRLVSLLALNYVYELAVMVPAIGVSIYFGGFHPVTFLFTILCCIAVPLLALAFSMLVGWVIALISSHMRKKNLVVMVCMVVFMGAYLYFCFMWQSLMAKMAAHGSEVAEIFSKYLFPFYHIGKAAGEGSVISLVITFLITAIPFAAASFLISKSFIRIATTKRGAKKIEYKGGRQKKVGPVMSIAISEMSRFLGSPTYMLNAGMGLIFIALGAGYILYKKDDIIPFVNMTFGSEFIPLALIMMLLFAESMVMISAVVISLDAKTLWISKVMPLKEIDILTAKAMPHILLSLPVVFAATVMMQFVSEMTLIGRAAVIVTPIAAIFFNAFTGLLINLHFPKFNWNTEAVAVKQSAAPMIALLVSFAVNIVMILINHFLDITSKIGYNASALTLMCIYIVLAAVSYMILRSKGASLYRGLQND